MLIMRKVAETFRSRAVYSDQHPVLSTLTVLTSGRRHATFELDGVERIRERLLAAQTLRLHEGFHGLAKALLAPNGIVLLKRVELMLGPGADLGHAKLTGQEPGSCTVT